jgi:DNA primase
MDENAHKALLDQPGAPRRWIKTNPAGWFGFETPACLAEWVVLVEGGFDRLALLAAGLPANAVIALVGTAARPAWLTQLAPKVKSVVLALDADDGGEVAMKRLAGEFWQAGFTVTRCPLPPNGWGKDWSERFRRLGPQSLWPLYDAYAHAHAKRDEGR